MMSRSISQRTLAVEQLESRLLFAINPTAEEQELLLYINRFRTDPIGEFDRLFTSVSPLRARDSSMQPALDAFRVDGNMLKRELAAFKPVAPVTWNEAVSAFSATHNSNMIAQNRLFHTDTLQRRDALLRAGVPLVDPAAQERISEELVSGRFSTAFINYASYLVDWGSGSGGMQTGRGHRNALGNGLFDEMGAKITATSASGLNPKVNTLIFANIKSPAVRVSGAVFQDKNGSDWYDAGEGVGGAKLTFERIDGQAFSTTAFSAGGYQIDLPAGSYKVRVTGGGMQKTLVRTLTVSNDSLWVNFEYVPTGPNPDLQEPNDNTIFSSRLSAPNATVSNLSLHSNSDVDFFRYQATTTGTASFSIQFTNSAGNINLQLLNASGAVLQTSAGTSNVELITYQVEAGSVYYLKVYGNANPSYSISAVGPVKSPPIATDDRTTVTSDAPQRTISILSNDNDPDGSRASLVPEVAGTLASVFTLNTNKTVTVQSPTGFSGLLKANYTVVDADGLRSNTAVIEVFVVNFKRPRPWQNDKLSMDVNVDGKVSAVDALMIINYLNSTVSRILPTAGSTEIYGFIDTNGDGKVTATDALLVINDLNKRMNGSGEGEVIAASSQNRQSFVHDQAIDQLMSFTPSPLNFDEIERKRRRS